MKFKLLFLLFFCAVLILSNSCTKFEGSENQWTARLDNLLCKDTFEMYHGEGAVSRFTAVNRDEVKSDYPYYGFIQRLKIKFDKDGTCDYYVELSERWEEANPPDENLKYKGSFNGVQEEWIEGEWRLTGKKKKNLEILFNKDKDDWVLYLIHQLAWSYGEGTLVLHYFDDSYNSPEIGDGIEEIKLNTEKD